MEESLREIGLITLEGLPIKVLFLVSQNDAKKNNISFWWNDPESNTGLTSTELALLRVFEERGFHPINRLLHVPESEYPIEMRKLMLPTEQIVRWGELFNADVVINGRTKIVEGEGVSMIFRIFDVETKSIIFEGSQIERADSISEKPDQVIHLLERAIRNVSRRIGPEIIQAKQTKEVGVNIMEVELRGLKNFDQFRKFKEFLINRVEGVISVIQTKIRGTSMFLRVEFTGKEDAVLDNILKHEELPFRLALTRTETDEIVVSIQ